MWLSPGMARSEPLGPDDPGQLTLPDAKLHVQRHRGKCAPAIQHRRGQTAAQPVNHNIFPVDSRPSQHVDPRQGSQCVRSGPPPREGVVGRRVRGMAWRTR